MLELCCSNMAVNFSLSGFRFFPFLEEKRLMPLNCLPYQIKRYPVFHFVFWWNTSQAKCLRFVYLGQCHTRVVLWKESCMLRKQTNTEFWCWDSPLSVGFCLPSGLFKQWWLSFRNKHTEHFLAGNCDAGQNQISK